MAIFQNMTQPQTQAPKLRGIFALQRDTPYGMVNNSDQDDASFYSSYMSRTGNNNFDYLGRDDQGSKWGVRPGSFLETLNKDYGNIANLQDSGGGGSRNWRLNIDHSKLPKTKFGDLQNVIEVTDANRDKILDKRLIYNDPNYGEITHAKNYKRSKVLPMLPAIVGMGMGGMLGAAGFMGNGLNTAQGLMRAGSGLLSGGNPLASIANMALGQVGIPANLRPFVNMAISQLLNQRRGG